jgi:predicted PhzF superfamily epimerase YddE/YHI9
MMKMNYSTLFYVFTGNDDYKSSLGRSARGNPANVIVVDEFPDFQTHKKALSAHLTTTYIRPRSKQNEYDIRWFNSTGNIERCGHGTLAAAAFLASTTQQHEYIFHSNKETLSIFKENEEYSLALPIEDIKPLNANHFPFDYKSAAQTEEPNGYAIAELSSNENIQNFKLTPQIIDALQMRALIITSKSAIDEFDIIFRYFAPQYDSEEDSATGSAASVLWPFWQCRIKKAESMTCYQASYNGGIIKITSNNKNIIVSGKVISA